MKKLINDPASVVPEMLEGLTRLYPDLALLRASQVVIRASGRAEGVALISGGGSGHEPAHAGFVGPGLLHAAVAGDVFTSPSTDAVLAAIHAVAGPAGALLIVKNYTGDRLNFGLAAEMARTEGIPVAIVVVDDDVALATETETGRRGIAGTVLVHKVAGAAAAAGLDLAGVAAEARAAVADLASMGVALSACTVPQAGKPGFTLGDNEIELGLGIHGEAGIRRVPIAPADQIVESLLSRIMAQKAFRSGDRVALLINNLGGTPAMELLIIARHALAVLERHEIVVERAWAGAFLTSIEMAGCSISLLRLDDARLAWLDSAASAPAWTAGHRPQSLPPPAAEPPRVMHHGTPSPRFEAALRAVCAALANAEPVLSAMDRAVGDGDLGISLARAAAAILEAIPRLDLAHPPAALAALSVLLRRVLGGTSGPLYAVMLLRSSRHLSTATTTAPLVWVEAFADGVQALAELGGARPGDRTMLDALLPSVAALREELAKNGTGVPAALAAAAAAAREGAAATANMTPRRGRSSYLGARSVGHPDPGAEAVAIWLGALAADWHE